MNLLLVIGNSAPVGSLDLVFTGISSNPVCFFSLSALPSARTHKCFGGNGKFFPCTLIGWWTNFCFSLNLGVAAVSSCDRLFDLFVDISSQLSVGDLLKLSLTSLVGCSSQNAVSASSIWIELLSWSWMDFF